MEWKSPPTLRKKAKAYTREEYPRLASSRLEPTLASTAWLTIPALFKSNPCKLGDLNDPLLSLIQHQAQEASVLEDVQISHIWVGVLMVADDLALSSGTVGGIQDLITEAELDAFREHFSFSKI